LTLEEFYLDELDSLEGARDQVTSCIEEFIASQTNDDDLKPVVYYQARIKSPESMLEKLQRKGYEQTLKSALENTNDAVGVRVITAFNDDVFKVYQFLKDKKEFQIIKEKDYISYPKDSGYRSFHMIVKVLSGPGAGQKVEIQLRSIASDFWATLEHKINYKKDIEDKELIEQELKRCADEIASLDLSMQTLRDIIRD